MIAVRRAALTLATRGSLFLLFLSPAYSRAQQTADLNSLLHSVADKFKAAASEETRLTYRIFQHQINYNLKGKKLGDFTSLSELLYLNGHPYIRRLELNGKPLSGKDLEIEQKLYDDAVKAGAGFSDKQRAVSAGGKYKEVNIDINRLLTDYDSRIAGRETVDGHDCILIDAMPKPDVPDLHRHVRLWIDPVTKETVKVAFDLLADENDLEKGSSGWMQMKTFNGLSTVTASHIDYLLRIDNHKHSILRLVTDSTMSNFRRFGSTVEILPPSETHLQ